MFCCVAKWEALGYELANKQNIVVAEVTLTTDDDDDPYGMGGGAPDNGVMELMEQYGISPLHLPAYRLTIDIFHQNPSWKRFWTVSKSELKMFLNFRQNPS